MNTASRLSLGNYDLEVNGHEKTSVCGCKYPDGLQSHMHHDSDDHF